MVLQRFERSMARIMEAAEIEALYQHRAAMLEMP